MKSLPNVLNPIKYQFVDSYCNELRSKVKATADKSVHVVAVLNAFMFNVICM